MSGRSRAGSSRFVMFQRFKICKGLLRFSFVHSEPDQTKSIFTIQKLSMSKENALDFLKRATDNSTLSEQVKGAGEKTKIVDLAKQHGFEFSEDDMKNAIPAIQEQSGFFGELAKAVLELFAPAHDDYPATGVQPFTGELSGKH